MTERDTVLRDFFETELENPEMFRELAAFLPLPISGGGSLRGMRMSFKSWTASM